MTTSTIGTSARDYSTVQAWENAAPADITAAGTNEDWIGECYNDSEFLVTSGSFLTVAGTTTDATHRLILRPASGQGFKDAGGASSAPLRYNQANGVAFRCADGYGWMFRIENTTHILIKGIQFFHDVTGSFAAYTLSGENAAFEDCIGETRKASAFAEANYLGKCINCIFVSRGSTWTGTMFSGGWELYNCTIFRPSDLTTGGTAVAHSIYSSPAGPLVKNSAVFGAFTTMFGGTLGSYQAGTGYNASSVASGSMPGTNNQASLTLADQFENTADATRDLRPKSGNSLQNGLRDQTNTNDLDIIGAARPTSGATTIGAREMPAAGPADIDATAPLAMLGAIGVSGDLSIDVVIDIGQVGTITLQGTVGTSADVSLEIKRWRVSTNAPEGTPVHVIVFSGSNPTYGVLAQGNATVQGGAVLIAATGTIGTKAFALVHNFDDNEETTSINGGPCVAELIDAG